MFLVDLFQYSNDVTNDVILNCIFIPYSLLDKMKFRKLFSSLYNYILGVFTEKPQDKSMERKVLYIPITTSSHATSLPST